MRHLRLGKKKKKNQKWRRPKGRDSKMRLKMKGYPVSVSIGYKKSKKESGKIKGLIPINVSNLNDLKKANKNTALILSSKLGSKKRIDLIKKADEMKLTILNVRRQKNETG